jgi:septum site-determining protein MinC
MSDSSLIQIKGLRDGLLVTVGEAAWSVAQEALFTRIEQQPAFFQGARVALDVGEQTFKVTELSQLRDMLSEKGISLWAVVSTSPVTESTAQMLGLATRIHKPRPQEFAQPVVVAQAAVVAQATTKTPDEDAALWVGRTLRSGVRVEYAGNVVVLGDVNPGAEVIASGSVIVWGRLRGVVHAGAQGNKDVVVCALDLSPTQLRLRPSAKVAPSQK